jgi:hypothetical protein
MRAVLKLPWPFVLVPDSRGPGFESDLLLNKDGRISWQHWTWLKDKLHWEVVTLSPGAYTTVHCYSVCI